MATKDSYEYNSYGTGKYLSLPAQVSSTIKKLRQQKVTLYKDIAEFLRKLNSPI